MWTKETGSRSRPPADRNHSCWLMVQQLLGACTNAEHVPAGNVAAPNTGRRQEAAGSWQQKPSRRASFGDASTGPILAQLQPGQRQPAQRQPAGTNTHLRIAGLQAHAATVAVAARVFVAQPLRLLRLRLRRRFHVLRLVGVPLGKQAAVIKGGVIAAGCRCRRSAPWRRGAQGVIGGAPPPCRRCRRWWAGRHCPAGPAGPEITQGFGTAVCTRCRKQRAGRLKATCNSASSGWVRWGAPWVA